MKRKNANVLLERSVLGNARSVTQRHSKARSAPSFKLCYRHRVHLRPRANTLTLLESIVPSRMSRKTVSTESKSKILEKDHNHRDQPKSPERSGVSIVVDALQCFVLSGGSGKSDSVETIHQVANLRKTTVHPGFPQDAQHIQHSAQATTDPVGQAVQGYVLQQLMSQMQSLAQTVQGMAAVPAAVAPPPKASKPRPEFTSGSFAHQVKQTFKCFHV